METIDKKGRKVTRADIEAQAKHKGQQILYVIDADLKAELIRQGKQLRAIVHCLSYMSNLNIKEEDIT